MSSRQLCEYTEPGEIHARVAELRAKAERITLYDESVVAGAPDVGLLDEKQQLILLTHGCEGGPFPGRVFRTLRRTIDVLESRLRRRGLAVEYDRALDAYRLTGSLDSASSNPRHNPPRVVLGSSRVRDGEAGSSEPQEAA